MMASEPAGSEWPKSDQVPMQIEVMARAARLGSRTVVRSLGARRNMVVVV